MKNLSLLLFTLLTLNLITYSQGCLPEGIIFTTQEQIDNFQINYPGCSEIEGNLEISGNSITNIDGLSVLTAIDSNLWIHSTLNLPNLEGLNNLTYIGRNLSISSTEALFDLDDLENLTFIGGGLYLQGNMDLSSISALLGLTHIGDDIILASMPWLVNLTGLNNITSIDGNLHISQLDGLGSLSDLNNLTQIGGNVLISDNQYLSSLYGLSNLTMIGGDLAIRNITSLTNLYGLMDLNFLGGDFEISSNNNLLNLTGVENLDSISGDIMIFSNNNLNSLEGINNIYAESIDNLFIFNNNSLTTCEVSSICEYIASPVGSINIYSNAYGCNTIEQVEEACGIISFIKLNHGNLFDISPNPCSSYTSLQFKISERGLVNCEMFDPSGIRVKQLINEEKIPGNYEIKIDLSDMPAGIYFCTLKTNNLEYSGQTKKMIKL